MSWTAEELAELEKNYKSGIKEIHYRDRKTVFNSMSEMRQLIEEARRSIGDKEREHFKPEISRGFQ